MCTSLTLQSENQHVLLGRTMDFPVRAKWHPTLINSTSYQTALSGTRKLIYPYVGGGRHVGNTHILIADGVNTAGLSCAELMFPIKAHYLKKAVSGKLNLTPQDFLPWVLGEHISIAEVIADLDRIALIGKNWLAGNEVFAFHWILADQTGRTLIVEPTINGVEVIADSIGVLTNSPTYPEHMKRFQQRLAVSPTISALKQKAHQIVLTQRVPAATNTPTSRFLEAAIIKLGSATLPNQFAARNRLFNILNAVAIPYQPTMNDHPNFNYTHYISILDTSNQTYFFTYHDSNQVFSFSLPELLDHYPKTNQFLA
ncbi:linear amide C-N hydrolase [Lentilactobacillus kisonensis]|nr:linear amide C-N hydrolase [Lentilactobacillus kisonensis]